jgi:peptidoglycan/LPS O-acetylase OafA/YrhL
VVFAFFPEAAALGPIVSAGSFAVPLFFILSGYVLALRYLSRFAAPASKDVLRFWSLRLGRVYPVHVFTLLISLGMVARHGWPTDEGHTLRTFAANLFMIHAWTSTLVQSWNYPSWSISSEWFAYLLFPLVAVACCRCGPRQARTLLALAAAVSAAVYAFEPFLVFKGLAVVVPTFIGGMALAMTFPPGSRSVSPRWSEAGLIAVAVLPFIVGPGPAQRALYLAIFFVLIGVLGANGHRAGVLWRSRRSVYLGEISYSLYMTHAIAITLIVRFVAVDVIRAAPFAVRAAVAGGCIVAIAGMAAATYYGVERPMRNWSRRLTAVRKRETPLPGLMPLGAEKTYL